MVCAVYPNSRKFWVAPRIALYNKSDMNVSAGGLFEEGIIQNFLVIQSFL